ncbi:MAG: hypothetical protein FWD68_07080 [Alphaproteobacteria bacterium]|nr:hypothetical protein [Alphaproteobacteria bacterium]
MAAQSRAHRALVLARPTGNNAVFALALARLRAHSPLLTLPVVWSADIPRFRKPGVGAGA